MNIVISLFIGAVVGFILGFLVFRNNADTFKEDEKDLLNIAKKFKKDDSGSIEVSPVSANALIKYLLRFGVPLACIIGLVALLRADMVSVMLYKCCLILAGFILAEFIWVVGYKYVFRRIEKEDKSEESKRSILMFRGMLYAAIILGLTLGL
jgi:phosphate/sulfate permease